MNRKRWIVAGLLAAGLLAGPSAAQLGGGLAGGLQRPLGDVAAGVGGLIGQTQGLARDVTRPVEATLNDLRLNRLADLVRAHPADLDVDPKGAPVIKGEVLAIAPSPKTLAAAASLGLTVSHTETLDDLKTSIVTFTAPDRLNVRDAVKRLKRADPAAQVEFNHVYQPVGGAAVASAAAPSAVSMDAGPGVKIGLIDTGAETGHPALAASHIEQRGFAPGGVKIAAHGTAVASLLAGKQGTFIGAAPGASLFIADVYGPTARGGSASAIAAALNWMAQTRPAVVNISLVGPPNLVLQAGVEALARRGVLIVAAVSNDGPAAPPAYPASYSQVIAVIGVDARGKALLETGPASHVDFAAPGAGVTAALPGGGLGPVRGASFAAPIVAGRLARLSPPSVAALAAEAQPVGSKGANKTYGHGLIGVAAH
jgi:subtilisin family serine protease